MAPITPHRLSILSRAAKSALRTEPYPHLVIENALDEALYAELERAFPRDDIILDGRAPIDRWFDYPACKVIEDARIAPLWREFFAHHTSQAFFAELVALVGPSMLALRPDLEKRVGRRLPEFSVAMRPGGRGDPLAPGADVSMECQFYLNYTRAPRVVRGPHVDRPSELFAALLYFRREEDDCTGSDLEICTAASDLYPHDHAVRIDRLPAEIDDEKVRTLKTVRYAANTLVLFLNSARSIHAVTPRSPTRVPRRHINFCCDVRFDLFDLKLPARLAAKRALEAAPMGWRLAKFL